MAEEKFLRAEILSINQETSVQNIQSDFTAIYPFLKLDFFRFVQPVWKTGAGPERIFPQEKIMRYSKKNTCSTISVEEYKTVQQLTDDFALLLDLTVQILRKAGNVWIETSLTLAWTLGQQNREGESISRISSIS